MTLLHSCHKHKFVKGFCSWLYLAYGVEEGNALGVERGRDEEVAPSKKKIETVQKSIPYL